MSYFTKFVSNTTASSANQFFFLADPAEKHTCRVFYRVTVAGRFAYSLLFGNTLDSTYADGKVGHANMECLPWTIHALRAAPCNGVTEEDLPFITLAENTEITSQRAYTTPPVELTVDHYLCIEMTFSGAMLPYHEETLLPILEKTADGWQPAKKMPLPLMVGVRREVKGRICYLGDSITQGIGTPMDSYAHWNALLAEKIGETFAHYNLGIGYARAHDIASHGYWLERALQNDIVFLCIGANDILQSYPEQQIKADLMDIVTTIKNAGKTLLLQAVPPFEYGKEKLPLWERVNAFLRETLAPKADLFFDPAPVLTADGKTPLYGGHPNETGCALWAEGLYQAVRHLF